MARRVLREGDAVFVDSNHTRGVSRDMRISTVLILAAVISYFPSSKLVAQTRTGHIQIMAEPDFEVFVDDVFQGITNKEQSGLIIQDIQEGHHTLRVTKSGYKPEELTLFVPEGEIVLHRIRALNPGFRVDQEGRETDTYVEAYVGTILVQTLPVVCSFSIPELGIQKRLKTKDKLIIRQVPSGAYTVRFEASDKNLETSVAVRPDEQVHLMVNLVTGEAHDLVPGQDYGSTSATLSQEMWDVSGLSNVVLPEGADGYSEDLGGGVSLVMLRIPGGAFTMGSSFDEPERDENEGPARGVTLSPFWMSMTDNQCVSGRPFWA